MPTLKAIWYEHLSDMFFTFRSVHNKRRLVAATSRGHISLRVYRSGDKLQQQVEATYLSVCTGRATSCSNKPRPHITPCVQVGRQVEATSRGDLSLSVYRSGDKLQQQVETTYHSVCTGRATSCSNTLRRHITPCA